MQPVSMYFTMNNVDLKRLAEWAQDVRRHSGARDPEDRRRASTTGCGSPASTSTLQQWQQDTGVKLQRDNITLKTADGLMYVNGTRVLGVDVFSPDRVHQCDRRVLSADRGVCALPARDACPGFENAPHRPGVADPRRARDAAHRGRVHADRQGFARRARTSTTASPRTRPRWTSTTPRAATSTSRACPRTRFPIAASLPLRGRAAAGGRPLHFRRPRGACALAQHAGVHGDRPGGRGRGRGASRSRKDVRCAMCR